MRSRNLFYSALLASCLSLSSIQAFADNAAPDYSSLLTGEWNGQREKLHNSGIDIDAKYKMDLWRNTSGGVKNGNAASGNFDLKLTVDGEELYELQGSKIFFHFINSHGGQINSYTGANGGIDNIEVANPNTMLYEAWIQQNFLDDKVSALIGLYDLNTEFYVTDTSGLFLNPTYGMGTEMALTGVNGPSIFPVTSVGARIIINPTDQMYIQAALLDGVPGDPNNAQGTHIQFNDGDGALIVTEVGYRDETNGHYALGAWKYTNRSDDWLETTGTGDPIRKHNQGYYALAERTLFNLSENGERNIDGFFRLGFANEDVSQFNYSWSAGLVFNQIFTSRTDSQLGFAVSSAHNSKKYNDSVVNAGGRTDSQETQLELTYSDKIMPWLTIQPDIQYTINPGADPALKNAVTAGIRLTVDF